MRSQVRNVDATRVALQRKVRSRHFPPPELRQATYSSMDILAGSLVATEPPFRVLIGSGARVSVRGLAGVSFASNLPSSFAAPKASIAPRRSTIPGFLAR